MLCSVESLLFVSSKSPIYTHIHTGRRDSSGTQVVLFIVLYTIALGRKYGEIPMFRVNYKPVLFLLIPLVPRTL